MTSNMDQSLPTSSDELLAEVWAIRRRLEELPADALSERTELMERQKELRTLARNFRGRDKPKTAPSSRRGHSARYCDETGREFTPTDGAEFCPLCGLSLAELPDPGGQEQEIADLYSKVLDLERKVQRLDAKTTISRTAPAWTWVGLGESEKWSVWWGIAWRNAAIGVTIYLVVFILAFALAN